MAQIVKVWERDITYTEGPFVMVQSSAWRIYMNCGDYPQPIAVTKDIRKLLSAFGYRGLHLVSVYEDFETCAEAVDFLNDAVKIGTVVFRPWESPADNFGTGEWVPCFDGQSLRSLHAQEEKAATQGTYSLGGVPAASRNG